jgi:hypothetical protein
VLEKIRVFQDSVMTCNAECRTCLISFLALFAVFAFQLHALRNERFRPGRLIHAFVPIFRPQDELPTLSSIHANEVWKTTDKGTGHSYIRVYERLFASKRLTARNVLEIGVFRGGSILLWHAYYPNATIYGCDITANVPDVLQGLVDSPRMKLFLGEDAYALENVRKNFYLPGITLDVIVDDGPHTLESMKYAVKYYLPLLSERGIFVIEDIQSLDWTRALRELVPAEDRKYVYVLDLRQNQGRYDDIQFIVDKEVPQSELSPK